jgi:two-component system, chemotaxis family, chemotaxis protein CheY
VRVLIVDDSKAMRMIVSRELQSAGFPSLTVAEAACAMDALATLEEFNPQLVLSDWNMPGMTGLEFLQKLRSDGCAVPFGFITTEASAEMRNAAADAGAFGFITKPFTAEDLREAFAQFA